MILKKIILSGALMFMFSVVVSSKSLSKDNPVSTQSNKTILFWNEVSYKAFGGTAYQHSLMASRINAMVHLAIHDALNGIEEKYNRWAFYGKDEKADPIAAAASAAYYVLLVETPDRKSFLDSTLTETLLTIQDGDAKSRGIELGKKAAQSVIAKRNNDGSTGELVNQVPVSNQPGIYQAVPPFNFLYALHWENVKPFALQNKAQFRSAPYPALNSQIYATALNEVKAVGQLKSTIRTADQSAYAKFWFEFSEAGWNRVARTAAINKKLNMLETARLLALVDMAIADAYIAGWDSKIHYNFWRPFTAIRKADSDNNLSTSPDTNWEPAEPTPPAHDYPSTHSALGNAAATVMAEIMGDKTSFSMSTPTAFPVGTSRSFKSFSEAANENADSRVRAGIHFRFSCDAGQEMGNKIGKWIVGNYLTAIK